MPNLLHDELPELSATHLPIFSRVLSRFWVSAIFFFNGERTSGSSPGNGRSQGSFGKEQGRFDRKKHLPALSTYLVWSSFKIPNTAN